MSVKSWIKDDGPEAKRGIILGHVFGGTAFLAAAVLLGSPVHDKPETLYKVSTLTDGQIHCLGQHTLELTLSNEQKIRLAVKECNEARLTP